MNVNDQSCDDSLFTIFFFRHTYTPARGRASLMKGEGVGATDCRVWHMRTFPRATDVRPTHSPKGRGRRN